MILRIRLLSLLVSGIALAGTSAPSPAANAPAKLKAGAAEERYWSALAAYNRPNQSSLKDARRDLQAAADGEFTPAQVAVGTAHLTGSGGFEQNDRKAADYFRLAAERGNGFAQAFLGWCYLWGRGVRQSDAKAIVWLEKADKPDANFDVVKPPPDFPFPTNVDLPVAGALESDPVVDTRAAVDYFLGVALARKNRMPEAQTHLVAAATAGPDGRDGIPSAAVAAAVNYAFGKGIPRDLPKANHMLEVSKGLAKRSAVNQIQKFTWQKAIDEFAVADLEESVAEELPAYEGTLQLDIAQMFGDEESKDYNPAEALKWYELAAESGQGWAMVKVALMYARGGNGRPPDPVKAFGWFKRAGEGKNPLHVLAAGNLAICLREGIGTERNEAAAKEIFDRFRYIDFICNRGAVGQAPKAPIEYFEAVELHRKAARSSRDFEAQYLLGLRYWNGWGYHADLEEAIRWFKRAAKHRFAPAFYMLGVAEEYWASDPHADKRHGRNALEYFREGIDLHSAPAAIRYAELLRAGQRLPQDLSQAEELYRKVLTWEPDNTACRNGLGELYEDQARNALARHDEARLKVLRTQMLAEYEAAAAHDEVKAINNLGAIYLRGDVVPPDYRKAYTYFDEAVAKGMESAHFGLGLMHETGLGVPVTYTEAAYHYRLAALDGHPDALRRLVNFYLTGQGVSRDLDRAMFWLYRLAAAGNTQGLTTYCDILIRRQEYELAWNLLNTFEVSSQPEVAAYAFDRLATLYTNGWGVRADPDSARYYTGRAIKAGQPDALARLGLEQVEKGKVTDGITNLERAAPRSRVAAYALGLFYSNGQHVPKDGDRGLAYLKHAASLNHPDALYLLATYAYDGKSGAPSLDEAIDFAQRAASGGNLKAARLHELLELRRREGTASPPAS